jgi:hypothetical protein
MVNKLKQGDLDEFMNLILSNYYDPLYTHSLEKLRYHMELDSDKMESAILKLKKEFSLD